MVGFFKLDFQEQLMINYLLGFVTVIVFSTFIIDCDQKDQKRNISQLEKRTRHWIAETRIIKSHNDCKQTWVALAKYFLKHERDITEYVKASGEISAAEKEAQFNELTEEQKKAIDEHQRIFSEFEKKCWSEKKSFVETIKSQFKIKP
jgi:hypothetical protein